MIRPSSIAICLLLACVSALAGVEVKMADGEVATVTQSSATRQAQLRDGTRLVGVDMSWYAPATPDQQALSDDDREQIKELLTVPSFYDRTVLLHTEGDSQRVVGLVELVRDRDFHAGKGEVIWRVELWYFEFQNGGWAKVSQQNRVIDRQRFASADDYRRYVSKVRFVPRLGRQSAATLPSQIPLAPSDLIAPSPAQ